MIPSLGLVLAWRWGVATIIRLGATGLVGWTLWTYVPILFGQFVIVPLNGRTPFYWLDPAAGLTGTAVQHRQDFYANLQMDALILAAATALWLLSGRLGALVVRFPRPVRRCPVCRYSLAALTSARCPECGLDLPATVVCGAARSQGQPPAPPAPAEPHPPARS